MKRTFALHFSMVYAEFIVKLYLQSSYGHPALEPGPATSKHQYILVRIDNTIYHDCKLINFSLQMHNRLNQSLLIDLLERFYVLRLVQEPVSESTLLALRPLIQDLHFKHPKDHFQVSEEAQ